MAKGMHLYEYLIENRIKKCFSDRTFKLMNNAVSRI